MGLLVPVDDTTALHFGSGSVGFWQGPWGSKPPPTRVAEAGYPIAAMTILDEIDEDILISRPIALEVVENSKSHPNPAIAAIRAKTTKQ